MKDFRKVFGIKSEKLAIKHLKKNGYKILEHNYRIFSGEIDIIAIDGNTLAFIEVKARNSNRYGSPKHAVDYRKQKKISMVAVHYLKSKGMLGKKARFDVVAISKQAGGDSIEVIKNAFELPER